MSVEVKLPLQPCFPVMQNTQFILQPTWHDTHKVARSSSGINTVSIAPFGVENRYFLVPSSDFTVWLGTCNPMVYFSLNRPRFFAEILLMSSIEVTRFT